MTGATAMVVTLGMLITASSPGEGARQTAPAVTLELTDQHGQEVRYPFEVLSEDPPVVLIALADRKGAEANIDWARELAARYAPHIEGLAEPTLVILPVAHLQAVPKIFRGLVRRMFRSQKVEGEELIPIALDWTGQVEEQLGLEPAVPNVTVLDREGVAVLQRAGPVESEGQAVFEALDRLLLLPPGEWSAAP